MSQPKLTFFILGMLSTLSVWMISESVVYVEDEDTFYFLPVNSPSSPTKISVSFETEVRHLNHEMRDALKRNLIRVVNDPETPSDEVLAVIEALNAMRLEDYPLELQPLVYPIVECKPDRINPHNCAVE